MNVDPTPAIREVERLKVDRDEWRQQHENLLSIYRDQNTAIQSLRAEIGELRKGFERSESECARRGAERDRAEAKVEQQQQQLKTIFRLALDALSSAGSGPEYAALNAIYFHARGDAEPAPDPRDVELERLQRCRRFVERWATQPLIDELHPDYEGGDPESAYDAAVSEARDVLRVLTKDSRCRHSNQRRHNPDGTVDCCECGEQIQSEKGAE